jgi:hypothetical protein
MRGRTNMNKNTIKLSVYFIFIILLLPATQTIGVNITDYDSLKLNEPSAPLVAGPELGEPGVVYNFSFISIDPLGFDLFYYIEWGDGNTSEWIGPYPSNVSINVSHYWENQGNYTIRAKCNNSNGSISNWSKEHNISIQPFVILEIGEIVGGMLGITALINNTGIKNATDVIGRVKINGGYILIGDDVTNDIGIIEPGNSSGVYNVPVLGFGTIDIIVSVKCNELPELKKTAKGFLLFFYIILI